MEKSRICKICNRHFANGKAMGGHMRSHLAKLPLPPKPITPPPPPSTSKSPSSSSSSPNHLPSENRMQSYRSLNRDFTSILKPTLYDGESETGESSQKNPTRKRSKRHRNLAEQVAESVVYKAAESSEQVSSISDFYSEEEVAMCLLMLSKAKWTADSNQAEDEDIEVEGKEVEVDVQEDGEGEGEGNEDETYFLRSKSVKFKCETCNKDFRSYQALGGHRASHKKIKVEEASGSGEVAVMMDKRIFKCPFCDKVFESGQALGGHKKVHFSCLANAKNSLASPAPKPSVVNNLFDLNQPAPEDGSELIQLSLE